MQFQVPQFIETEDKIIGPFTIRQFVYMAAAGVISFFLFVTVKPWLWATGTLLVLTIALGFAFIKIEGRPLVHVMLSALNFYWRPQIYVWKSGEEIRSQPTRGGISLEEILSGAALRNAWRSLQTGTGAQKKFFEEMGHYQIFQKLSGERRAARRVDYR